MRKIFALLALVLGVVSCQTEPEGFDATVGGEKEVNITVSLPEATRANSALGAFDNVDFDLYDVRFQCEVHYGEVKKVLDPQFSDNGKSATFPVRLIPGRDYKFVVWADLVNEDTTEDLHYITDTDAGLSAITLNDTWIAMDETRDAYTCSEVRKFEGTGISLELTRPFAKLRVKTTDMNELMDVVPTSAVVEYTTPIYAKFNAVEGGVVANETTAKTHTYTYPIEDIYENSETTKILFTDYFFATAQQEVVKFNMTIKDQNGDNIGDTKYFNTAIPVQRNYLTTIAGNILTTGDNITVVIEDEFDGYYTVPSEVSELVNVINSAVDGVETIIPVNDDIELPQALTIPAGKNIVLDFAANTTLTGALVVEDDAELTINNGIIDNNDKSVSGITTNGNLTLNNVEIVSARHAVRVESGEVVIYGGTFEVKPVSASTLHALNVGDDGKSATVIIKGGTFRGPKGTMADSGSAVNVRNGSTVIIEGGNFSGGKTKTLSAGASATLIVKGGFFDQDPSAFVATGYTSINMNTTRSVIKEYVYAVMKGSEENGYYNILIEDTAALEFFAEVVDYEYTFAGDVVNLEGDIDLEGETWNPIGDNRAENAVFEGTFDGHNYTIKGLSKSSFDGSNYGSKEGWGLFSVVNEATIKNVNIDNATFGSYTVISGAISGYAHDTTFENINITNTKIAGYNWYTGGVTGWASGECTFKGINLDSTTAVGTLWDSHGQNAGGIAGGVSGDGTYIIEDCNIACVLDVINDVTSNYKWWIYRVSGMIIGNTNTTETKYNEVVTATATNVTCKNVTVTYGDWMNYHYCQGYWNRGWGRVESSDYVDGVDHTQCNHPDGESHYVWVPFDQLFGGSSNGSGHYPVRGLREFDGVTVNYPESFFREQGYKAEGDKYTVYSGNGFKDVATSVLADGKKNVTIELANDIDLAGIEWPAVSTNAAFVLDGKGYAIKNLTTSAVEDHGFYSTAMFTSTRKATTIKNLVVENATVTGKGGDNSHGAVLVACNYAALNIEGVTVKNSTVSNCDRSSVIATYLYFTTATVKNCVVEGCTVNSIGTAGALLGMNNSHNFEATGNTVKDTTISSSEGSNKAGILIGTWQDAGTLTESNNVVENSKAINAGTETNNNIGRHA